MVRLTHGLFLFLMLALASAPALAQDEPLIGGDEEPPPAPAPAPDPAPAPTPAPQPQPGYQQPQPGYQQPQPQPTQPAQPTAPTPGEMTPRKQKDITDTDHDMVIKDIGLQIVYISDIMGIVGGGTTTPLIQNKESAITDSDAGKIDDASGMNQAAIGIRVWFTRAVGLDAGLSIYIAKDDVQDVDTQVGLGMYAGVPFALGVYRHVVMFAGPDVGFALWHVAENVTPWMFQLKGKAGLELSLGWMDIPRVSLIGSMSFGLRVFNAGIDGAETEIVVGNDHGFSFKSLFETNVGLVFYI